ncbi:MAG: hypothetical protein IPO22_02035 [Anaerolineales bacterium]|nr:hypothetical protein [Anaerolineales bacterium]
MARQSLTGVDQQAEVLYSFGPDASLISWIAIVADGGSFPSLWVARKNKSAQFEQRKGHEVWLPGFICFKIQSIYEEGDPLHPKTTAFLHAASFL